MHDHDRSLIFPSSEFQSRCKRLRKAMDRCAVDALFLTSAADIFYVTGFLTRFWESPARPWFVVIPAHGAPIAIIPRIGKQLMQQSWLSDIRTWDAPNPTDDGVGLLADAIAQITPKSGRIATPKGPETHLRMPLADYERLIQLLSPRQILDGTEIIQRTREIKSSAEIKKLRDICAIAGRAFAKLPQLIHVGCPADTVARDFQIELLREGADWVSYLAVASGPNGYDDVIAPTSDKPLQKGDVLMLDTGAVRDGYFCDFDRNLFLGPPSSAAKEVQEALWRATEDVIAVLRPGMRACDAHRLLIHALKKHGATPCNGRLGHGLGLALTEWPSLTSLDKTELRESMVLAIEPSAFVEDDRFLVHEENIVLREDGAELLSPRAPKLEAIAVQ